MPYHSGTVLQARQVYKRVAVAADPAAGAGAHASSGGQAAKHQKEESRHSKNQTTTTEKTYNLLMAFFDTSWTISASVRPYSLRTSAVC